VLRVQSIPDANSVNQSEFAKSSHQFWLVIDSSPDGLSYRWSENVPIEWYSSGSIWPRMNVWEWPVIWEALENRGLSWEYGPVIAGWDLGNGWPAARLLLTMSRAPPYLGRRHEKQTKREKFLSEMEVVVPWQALIKLIEPPTAPKRTRKAADIPIRWPPCCGSISCNSGTRSATRRCKRP
jgi:hypothetical protein